MTQSQVISLPDQPKSTRTSKALPKGPETKPWKSFPLDNYRTQADQLVTHSTKGVNTNAAAGGIRAVTGEGPFLPYACARFGREPVALDYTKNATQPFPSSVVTEQLDAVRTGNYERFTNVVGSECAEIREIILPLLDQSYDASGSRVSPRLKQILFHDDQRGDVCLTPIHSGGFSARLHRIMEDALAIPAEVIPNGASEHAFFDEVVVKIGGDKAQNAGRAKLVGAMQRAYRFAIPRGDPQIKRAWALHHKGVYMAIPVSLLEAYGRYLQGLRHRDTKQGHEAMRRTTSRMNKESQYIRAIVETIRHRGDEAYGHIEPHVGKSLDSIASPNLSLVQQGLLNPKLRQSQEWKEAFATEIIHRIANAKARDGETLIVGISGRSGEALQKHIMEALG